MFARRANLPHPDGHCLNPQIRAIILSVPPSQEGRFAIVTNVGSGMRWTRRVSRRMTMSRTAKSYGPGAPTLASSPQRRVPRLAGDGGKKARSPGRPRISRNTIAQGRPVAPAEPVVLPRAFLLHADHGCQPGARSSLRPLLRDRASMTKSSDASRRETAGSCRLYALTLFDI